MANEYLDKNGLQLYHNKVKQELTNVKSQTDIKLKEKASETSLEVERARITNLASMSEGATTNDAELRDIRVTVDGTIATNAGESVRKQINKALKKISVDTYDIASELTYTDGLLTGYDAEKNITVLTTDKYKIYKYAKIDISVINEIRAKLSPSTTDGVCLLYTNLSDSANAYAYSTLNADLHDEYVNHNIGDDFYTVDVKKLRDRKYKELWICYAKKDDITLYAANIKFKWQYDYSNDIKVLNDKFDKISSVMVSVNMFNNIAALGDSYTAGSCKHSNSTWTKQKEQSYIATMGKRAGIDWFNYGVPGATTRSYLTALDGLSLVLKETQKDFYFIAFGINDANSLGNSYLGTINDIHSDYNTNEDTFYGNYGKIISQLITHAPNAKLCLIKIPLDNIARTYAPFSNAIEVIANHFQIPFINPLDDLFFQTNLYLFGSDGHPTCGGYAGMGLAYERLFSKMVLENVEYFRYATVG